MERVKILQISADIRMRFDVYSEFNFDHGANLK